MKKLAVLLRFPATFLFLSLLGGVFLNQLTGIVTFDRKSENRNFRDSVTFNLALLDPFPADFEAYFSDNFSFRRPLLDLYHHLSFYYFHLSPHPDKTLIGNNNWFFMAGKEKSIIAGDITFSSSELKQLENIWQYRKHYLDSLGIPFMWLVAPMKHHVYPEYLPFETRKTDHTRTAQLIAHFDKNLPGVLFDLRPILIAAKKNNKLFYQLDNHWNFHAGEVASNLIIKQLQAKLPDASIPDLSPVSWRDSLVQNGIHYHVLGIDALYEIDQVPVVHHEKASIAIKHGYPPLPYFAYPDDYEMRFTAKKEGKGLKLLIIRDSFGNQLIPFVKESFEETVLIFDGWQYGLNNDIIKHFKPDVVIFLTSEVHIDNMLVSN